MYSCIYIYIYPIPSEIQFTDERFLRSTPIAFEDTMCIYPLETLESLVTFQGVPLEDYYKNSTCAVR